MGNFSGWGPTEEEADEKNRLHPYPEGGRSMESAEYKDMRVLEGKLREILMGWGYGCNDNIANPRHSEMFSTMTFELACAALVHYYPEKSEE